MWEDQNNHPGTPPASIMLARVTSLDQTSNCHFLRPSTPQCTRPVWIPTRMFTSVPVTFRINLKKTRKQTLRFKLFFMNLKSFLLAVVLFFHVLCVSNIHDKPSQTFNLFIFPSCDQICAKLWLCANLCQRECMKFDI